MAWFLPKEVSLRLASFPRGVYAEVTHFWCRAGGVNYRVRLHKRIKTLTGFRAFLSHAPGKSAHGRYGIIPRRNASSWTSRGACRASTIRPFTWISQAIGLSASRLGSVQFGSIGPIFNNSMIAVDFAEPVFGLRPKCGHNSSARMCGVWLLSNRKLTRPTE